MTGFDSKQRMAEDKQHWSDCAVHNAPAYHKGECDCGVAQEPAQEPVARERNFCERCGKRTGDLTAIHTCTPPQGNA